MALISCPECKKQVSDSAPACPNCGVSIASARESKASGARLTTTQVTSKKLKLQSLIALALIVIGIVGLFSAGASTAENDTPPAWPFLFFGAGLVWYFVTKFRIWWHHK